MRCSKCSGQLKVVDSRLRNNTLGTYKYRRYKCKSCGSKFTTHEEFNGECLSVYDSCYQFQEYRGADCNKCPYEKECGGI